MEDDDNDQKLVLPYEALKALLLRIYLKKKKNEDMRSKVEKKEKVSTLIFAILVSYAVHNSRVLQGAWALKLSLQIITSESE